MTRNATSPDATDPPALEVRELTKVYGTDDTVRAVDGVSLAVERGTVVGLLGPNGAGKTTTIKSILGLVVPTSGEVRVRGIDVHENPTEAYQHVGAMLEGARNTYWRLTVRENLRFFAALAGYDPDALGDRHDRLLAQFALEAKADTPVRELSRGQQQKVSLACTLARGADVVFLDEPTLGLDVESTLELRRELRALVDDGGITVVLSSHDMDVMQDLCDRVVIVNDGTIVADDSVENLLDVLHTNTYEITVIGGVDRSVRERLESRFGATFEDLDGRTRIRSRAVDDEFYDLVDLVRSAGLTVHAVDTVQPDLEKVFLHVTGNSSGPTGQPRPQARGGER